jgi:DNA-binding transcriptional ArsR family regulator
MIAVSDLISKGLMVQALSVAARLRIADRLRDRPMEAAELASAAGAHAPTLYRLLRALTGLGVLTQDDQSRFALVGRCLDSALSREATNDLFVSLLHQARRLMDRDDQHHELRSGPDSSSLEIGSACRWTILHSPLSRRNVVVTRRSNGSTESRSPIRARIDLQSRHELVARIAREFVEPCHCPSLIGLDA